MTAAATTVHALIERQAHEQPHAVYARATESERHITYGELARGCRRVSAVLRGLGMQPGDTVSVVMPNGLQTLRLLLGAMHGGFRVNPVNLLSQPEQMHYVLSHSDCRLVCVAPEWESRVRAIVEAFDRPVKLVVVDPEGDGLPGEEEAAADVPPPSPDAVALLMYTSGTTGNPKGVMLTQRNLAANAHAISVEHQLRPSDRVLAVLPLYHINAFTVTMLAPLAHGGSLAMPPKFSAGRFWEQATQTQCSWINVVPTMISYLLEGPRPPLAQTLSIRFCRSASAALPPEHLRAFEQMFGIGIVETMGLTETAAPSFSNPMDPAARKIGSVGRASGCMAGVVDAQLAAVPDGTTGELVIRGPNVMLGYYKNEEATRASFTPDGWLRTGDLGHRDEDGFFFVTGRIKELIIKGGENIAPREIDEALLKHPAVLEAVSVGVPDRHYGQEIGVCIVLREGSACTEEQLREFAATVLGRYKAPGHYRFVQDLPRGPSGKVQRLKLMPLFQA
ncbi:acyl-CoA synthetase (AMP-forming)/AMP-acid ligase II [Variovorax sp. SG517]|uniref:AMP-binding protein n=1 Tax=Variovorax sp. SG517 TaxID=2587117 RepID=UPI00159E5CEE|nr:AMP-binding protein [Variovorax sp. SG517]NVM86398.1 acyl-CoA synthetase (AMP-forming)/AMP-acid ligase II [Variovorax sp. SG517]